MSRGLVAVSPLHPPRRVAAALSADVVARVRADILDGRLAPATPLREAALASRFEVSRRTVREALLILTEQGLAVHRHNSGAAVRSFTADDVADLYRVRRLLELEGVRSSVTAPHSALEGVERAFGALEDAARDGIFTTALAEADMAFHASVIELNGSPRINEFYARIATQMTYAITILQRHDEQNAVLVEGIVAEHRAIRDAVLARDLYGAQRLVLEHIGTYEQRLLVTAPSEATAPTGGAATRRQGALVDGI